MTAAASNQNVQCPRCGYDLRGTVSTWNDACPLHGICTECGLEINWSHVLQPEKFEPTWCIEYTPRRAWLRSCTRTILRSFLPWSFWTRLSMHHRIRWLRLALYVGLLTLVPLFMPYLLVQSAAALYMRSKVQANLNAQLVYHARSTRPTELPSAPTVPGASHQDLLAQHQAYWDAQQAWAASSPRISHSAWYCVFEAVCFPARPFSKVTITGTPQRAYPAPAEMHGIISYWLAGELSRRSSIDFATVSIDSAVGYTAGMAIFFLLPLTFVLLPVSRRKAKVRWRHIVRVTAYGVFLPVTALMLIGTSLTLAIVQASPLLYVFTVRLSWWFVPVALVLWWTAAIGRYLKMPHATITAILMTVLSALTVLAIVYLVVPNALIAWLMSW